MGYAFSQVCMHHVQKRTFTLLAARLALAAAAAVLTACALTLQQAARYWREGWHDVQLILSR
jgi:hypothetical protein